jgi:hypothetical protein
MGMVAKKMKFAILDGPFFSSNFQPPIFGFVQNGQPVGLFTNFPLDRCTKIGEVSTWCCVLPLLKPFDFSPMAHSDLARTAIARPMLGSGRHLLDVSVVFRKRDGSSLSAYETERTKRAMLRKM